MIAMTREGSEPFLKHTYVELSNIEFMCKKFEHLTHEEIRYVLATKKEDFVESSCYFMQILVS